MRYLLPFAALILLCSCRNTTSDGLTVQVEYVGALKNMMRKGDISAQIDLTELSDQAGIYALGAVTNLKGEVLILDSKPYISYVQADSLLIDSTFDHTATLLVYSNIEQWQEVQVPTDVKSESSLEEYIENKAEELGINVDAPFPFRLIGTLTSMDWHVINWKDGDLEHTHEKHVQSGLHDRMQGVEVDILGFYSNRHHAIFTHHTTNMHMHVRTTDGQLVAHVDDLELGTGMKLLLPATKVAQD